MRRIGSAALMVLVLVTLLMATVGTASAQINGGITMMTTRTLKVK